MRGFDRKGVFFFFVVEGNKLAIELATDLHRGKALETG